MARKKEKRKNPDKKGVEKISTKKMPLLKKGIEKKDDGVNKTPKKILPQQNKLKESGDKILEEYQIELDKAIIHVKIEKRTNGKFYIVQIPEIQKGTHALIEEIRKELITLSAIGGGEILDKASVDRIKSEFMNGAKKILHEKIPTMDKKTEEFIVGILLQDMLGLGEIEFLINDENLEEIVIVSSKEPVRTYHKKYGWLTTNIKPKSEDEINNYANIIARRVGRQISILNPLLDAHIVTGDRANAVLYPVATKGHTITIRKFARDPWTIVDLIENKTASLDIAAIIWLAIEYEMNILISGGTASGKTVFLNACMPFMPPNHRIISMEDTRELMLPEFLYWCPLVTRSPNVEGKGEVSMLDLLVNSLRMRPDRIILGEIRRQKEAEVLFEAMHTGHSVYATVHADSANETIRRLINPPINIPDSMLKSVNLNVIMFRDRRKGVRRVHQLAEFIPGKESSTANILYRWIPDRDEIVAHNNSMIFFDDLSRHTGMSQKEISEELEKRKSILQWLIKNKIRDLNSIGKLMMIYYNDKEELEKIMEKNEVDKIIVKNVEKVIQEESSPEDSSEKENIVNPQKILSKKDERRLKKKRRKEIKARREELKKKEKESKKIEKLLKKHEIDSKKTAKKGGK